MSAVAKTRNLLVIPMLASETSAARAANERSSIAALRRCATENLKLPPGSALGEIFFAQSERHFRANGEDRLLLHTRHIELVLLLVTRKELLADCRIRERFCDALNDHGLGGVMGANRASVVFGEIACLDRRL